MKSVFFIFCFLHFYFLEVKGQKNYVLFSEDYFSYYKATGMINSSYFWYYTQMVSDTFNDNIYFRIRSYGNDRGTSPYFRNVREDINEQRVWYYEPYYNRDFLLYDLDLQTDDLIPLETWRNNPTIYWYKVSSDSIFTNFGYLNRMILKNDSASYFKTLIWMDEVGSLQYEPFYFNYSPSGEYDETCVCVYHHKNKIWENNSLTDSCPSSPPDTLLELINNHITGYIFDDKNKNCVKDSGETGLPNRIIEIQPGDYFIKTDSAGFFRASVGKDSFTVSLQDTNGLWMNKCNNDSSSYQVAFNSYRNNSVPLYFGIDSLAVYVDKQKSLKDNFAFYPNPSTGKINIINNTVFLKELSIEIFNLIGSKVISYSTHTGARDTGIDVSSLNYGIYFCVVKTEDGNTHRYKFILSK